jgi:hypothetical protein
MNKRLNPSLTNNAMRALSGAVAKAAEDHRRRGIPLAIWRDGKAITISATEAGALRETEPIYRSRKKKAIG